MKQFAITTIQQSLRGCLRNQITFPEHVKKLAEIEVIRYEVDLQANLIHYYFKDKTSHIEEIALNKLSTIIEFFDKELLKKAIFDVQKKSIDYPTFINHIVAAGTKNYTVDLIEKQVIYQGKKERFIEHFPTIK